MYYDVSYRVDRLDRRTYTWVAKGTFGRYIDARTRVIHKMNTERPGTYRIVTVTQNVYAGIPRPRYV